LAAGEVTIVPWHMFLFLVGPFLWSTRKETVARGKMVQIPFPFQDLDTSSIMSGHNCVSEGTIVDQAHDVPDFLLLKKGNLGGIKSEHKG